jgi:hypothetical protein
MPGKVVTRPLMTLAALAYVVVSANVMFVLWMHTGFCDAAERDCSLPWTSGRIALWAGWSLLGLAVMTATAVALRPRSGPLADRRIAAAGGAAVVIAGLAVGLMTKASNH